MPTPTGPRAKGNQPASDPEREAAPASHRRRGIARVRSIQKATSGVRPKVGAPSDLAANTAEAVSSTATKTVGSTARTATKTVGSTVQGAARIVGPALVGGAAVAFRFLVAKAMLLLDLIKQIALLAIEALRDLARRLRERYGVESGHSSKADGQRAEPVPM